MTWRRFLTLLRGLSPNSATVTSSTSRIELGSRDSSLPPVESEHAQATFLMLFGRGARAPEGPRP